MKANERRITKTPLIDKAAIVAEIERLKKNEGWCQVGKDTADVYYARGFRFACERIISFLDTLEVKEIDLEKELVSWRNNHFHGRRDKEASGEYLERVSQLDLAKHCFELGLKAQQEPISENLEEAAIQFATDTKTGKVDVVKQSSFFWGAIYYKQQMMVKAVDVTIAIPCQNLDGSYTQLLDSKEALPFGDKLKVLVIKED